MKKLDVAEFVRSVLAELDNLPVGFEERLVELVSAAPTTRWTRVRELIEALTRG